jgi:hypothetical protein
MSLVHTSNIASKSEVPRVPDCTCREPLDGAVTVLKRISLEESSDAVVAAGSSLGNGALYHSG